MDWMDRVVVVTGGSSGIGFATAQACAARGAAVVIVGRDATRLAGAASALGERASTVVADLRDEDEVDRLMSTVAASHGHLDLLFANAGVSDAPPPAETTRADFDRIVDTNVRGVFTTIVRGLPLLRRGASVVATSSATHDRGRPGDPLYAASKAAVRSLVRTLALDEDVLARGVRVNAVTPGCVATPLTGQDDPADQRAIDDWVTEHVPLGRWGRPEEIADAVLYLADAGYVTGAEIVIDGGLSQT